MEVPWVRGPYPLLWGAISTTLMITYPLSPSTTWHPCTGCLVKGFILLHLHNPSVRQRLSRLLMRRPRFWGAKSFVWGYHACWICTRSQLPNSAHTAGLGDPDPQSLAYLWSSMPYWAYPTPSTIKLCLASRGEVCAVSPTASPERGKAIIAGQLFLSSCSGSWCIAGRDAHQNHLGSFYTHAHGWEPPA